MIPIRDHSRPTKTPILTHVFIVVNVLVFIVMFGMSGPEIENFVQTYALIPAEVVNGNNLHSLITSMFLHGGLGHIFSNMLFLHVFGDNLEDYLGKVGYVLFYIVCGVGASFLQIVVNPAGTIPNLGASGAIAGLLGGYLVLFPKHKVDVLIPIGFVASEATVPASAMLIYWIGFQFLSGFGTLGVGSSGVAYFAHIGGFLSGVLLTYLIKNIKSNNQQN